MSARQRIRVVTESEIECDRSNSVNFIARGGFAEVYKGLLDRDVSVAIKYYKPLRSLSCISEESSTLDEHDYTFQHEVDVLTEIGSNPFVVSLHGVMVDLFDGTCNAIVLELAMCTLSNIIYHNGTMNPASSAGQSVTTSSAISMASKLTLLLDACRAMEHVHSKNITHNDIKPDNFLFFDSGILKFTDFGLASLPTAPVDEKKPAKQTHSPRSHRKCKSGPSTPATDLLTSTLPRVLRKCHTAYQAPELFVFPARCTTASDVYALGVVMNELLTSCPPFASVPSAMLPVQICGGTRPQPLYGDIVEGSVPTVFKTEQEAVTLEHNEELHSTSERRVRSDTITDDVTKRLRHLIRTCWQDKAKERPLSSAVVKIVAKLVESAGGERRDEYIDLVNMMRSHEPYCKLST